MPEPTLFGIGKAQWEMINSFANWLAAVGTVAAVIVSLYLASRNTHKAQLSCGLRILIGPGSEEPYPEYVVFRVVNHGDRLLRVTQIGWRSGLWKKRYAIQLYEETMSSKLPVDLEHGQEAQWFIPTNVAGEPWPSYFSRAALLPHYRLACFTLRAQAHTSIGKIFEAKPEANLRSKLLQTCKAFPKGTTAGPRRSKAT